MHEKCGHELFLHMYGVPNGPSLLLNACQSEILLNAIPPPKHEQELLSPQLLFKAFRVDAEPEQAQSALGRSDAHAANTMHHDTPEPSSDKTLSTQRGLRGGAVGDSSVAHLQARQALNHQGSRC